MARFAVPAPVEAFGGRSFMVDASGTWEALSVLPGHVIGVSERPALREVGAFVAAFHEVSIAVSTGFSSRPDGLALRRLPEMLDQALATLGATTDAVEVLGSLGDRFRRDGEGVGYLGLPTCAVHGDPTTFNVLADHEPPRPSGLIDFELADIDAAVADVSFSLWRSGRPVDDATELDHARIREFVAGYQSVRRLSDQELAAIPVGLLGRGLQRVAKMARFGLAPDAQTVARLVWIDDNRYDLARTVNTAT